MLVADARKRFDPRGDHDGATGLNRHCSSKKMIAQWFWLLLFSWNLEEHDESTW